MVEGGEFEQMVGRPRWFWCRDSLICRLLTDWRFCALVMDALAAKGLIPGYPPQVPPLT